MKTKTWPELTAFIYDDYDATLSAMTKTVQRAEQTQFTRAYYSSKQGILGTSDSPAITGVDDLNTLVEHGTRMGACRVSRCSSRLAHWALSRSAAATRPRTHQGTRRHPRRVPSCIMHAPVNAFLKG